MAKHSRIVFMTLLLFAAAGASAGVITVFDDGGFSNGGANIAPFYNANGHTATTVNALTAAALSGADLLIAWEAESYSAADIALMNAFLGGGGRIAFFGEWGPAFSTQNNAINTALTGLSSVLSIQNDQHDPLFHTASGPQITAHPLNMGVTSFEYAAASQINGVVGGNAIFLTSDLSAVFAAFDSTVGGGGIVVLPDSNVLDFDFGEPNGNGRWFLNLVEVDVSVPEPATVLLMGLGLAGLIGSRRRLGT